MKQWVPSGYSGGGAIHKAVISHHDPNLIIAPCDMGNTFISYDGGDSWIMGDIRQITGNDKCRPIFHPTDPNIIVAFSNIGILKSVDRGLSFSMIPSTLLKVYRGKAIHIDKQDPTKWYALCYDGGVNSGFKYSLDSGNTWSLTYTGAADFGPIALANATTTPPYTLPGFTSTGSDTYMGANIYSANGKIYVLSLKGVFRSDDGGLTWTNKFIGGTFCSMCGATDIYGNVTLYVTKSTDDKIYKSTDNGETWTSILSGLLPVQGLAHITCLSDNPNIVYVVESLYTNASTYGNVYKSTDGGLSWTNTFDSKVGGNVTWGWMDYQTGGVTNWGGGYLTGMNVCYSNPDYIVGCNYEGLFISKNGGQTWEQKYCNCADEVPSINSYWYQNGLTITNVDFIQIDNTNSSIWYTGNMDIGFNKSIDNGQTWRRFVSGVPTNSSNTCYAIVQHPTIAGTLYAGFSRQHDQPDQNPYGYQGNVYKSTNYGETWVDISTNYGLPNIQSPISLIECNNKLYVAKFGDGVYRLDDIDNNGTWTKIVNGLPTDNKNAFYIEKDSTGLLYCIITASGNVAYNIGGLYYSSDEGATWILLKALYRPYKLYIDPNNNDNLYLTVWDSNKATSEGGVYVSKDRGLNWTQKRITWKGIPSYAGQRYSALTLHPSNSNIVYASYHTTGIESSFNLLGGLIISNDGGETWTDFDTQPKFVRTNWLQFIDNTLYASTYGSGYWKLLDDVDTLIPTITEFTVPTSSSSKTIPVVFTATDNVAITGYLITETSSVPLLNNPNWNSNSPTEYVVDTDGLKTLYAWVKDGANNISTSVSRMVLVYTILPTISSFTIQQIDLTTNVSVAIVIDESIQVASYYISETSSLSGSEVFQEIIPTQYNFSSYGTKRLYCWIKDILSNTSIRYDASVVLVAPIPEIVATKIKYKFEREPRKREKIIRK